MSLTVIVRQTALVLGMVFKITILARRSAVSINKKRYFALTVFVALSSANINYAATQSQSDTCAKGYVWREAFNGDHVCVSPNTREQTKADNANEAQFRAEKDSDQCVQGLEWRLANPSDHVCVPQITRVQTAQDNELAYSRLASGLPEAPPRLKEMSLPLPPAKVGCHVFREGEWREIPCATPEATRKLRPPVALSIQNSPRFIGIRKRSMAFPYTLPLELGEIDIELLSDPARGTVTDVLTPGTCSSTTTTVNTQDSFSIQLNTNVFTTNYGSLGWVQFVNQTIPGGDDFLCVWKFDLNVASSTGNANGYDPICANPRPVRTFLGPAAAGIGGQIAAVRGFIQKSPDGTTLLTAWAQLPWTSSFAYAVTTTDTITGTSRGKPNDSKQYSFGLRGRWTQVTGDIYGTGCGSRAVFTGTRVLERVVASTCTSYPNCSSQAPMTQFSLPYFATPVPDPNVTGETNNLLPTVRPTSGRKMALHDDNTGFSCTYPEVCVRWGLFSSPN